MALRRVGPVGPQNLKTYLAEIALSRGLGVKVGANEGGCLQVTAAGGRGIGIATEDCAIGGAASISRGGDTVAIAGSAATQGQYAKFDASRRGIPVTGTVGRGVQLIGRFEPS